MLTLAAPLLLALSAVFRGLRHWIWALHLALVLGACYLLDPGLRWPVAHPQTIQWVLGLHLLAIQLVTFLAYFIDKRAAKHGSRRIPERTLHALMLVGGTLGAIAGQKAFRHKTKKESFRQMFWLIFMLQIAAVVILALR